MQKFPEFETERLWLRVTHEADAAFILELLNTPKWLKFIGDRKVHTLEDAAQYIQERIRPQYDRLGYANYTLVRKSDGTKIGSCGLYDRAGLEGVDLGFALLPAFEGQGYAAEAARRLINAAFREIGLPEISAITIEPNTASRKLLERLGFRFEKITHLPDDAEPVLYLKLKPDYL
ncbi:MAG: GNAT family N-acetyltransferase [Phaeodactylibacter sp.]|uniref:GNAT family N-acetyltransferase n=1 Tax=Phaeodactylibacter sp. TaxID=1940289 RepID=UPI0032EFB3E9